MSRHFAQKRSLGVMGDDPHAVELAESSPWIGSPAAHISAGIACERSMPSDWAATIGLNEKQVPSCTHTDHAIHTFEYGRL